MSQSVSPFPLDTSLVFLGIEASNGPCAIHLKGSTEIWLQTLKHLYLDLERASQLGTDMWQARMQAKLLATRLPFSGTYA